MANFINEIPVEPETKTKACQTIEPYVDNEKRADTLEKINTLLEQQIQSQTNEIEDLNDQVTYWKNYRFTKNKINQTVATKRASEYVQTESISKYLPILVNKQPNLFISPA